MSNNSLLETAQTRKNFKKQKNAPRKKFLVFQEMELFSSNIKKFRKAKRRKKFLIFQETETLKKLLIFRETNPFSPCPSK